MLLPGALHGLSDPRPYFNGCILLAVTLSPSQPPLTLIPMIPVSPSPPPHRLLSRFWPWVLFAISMVVFFGWRRMTAGRTTWVVPPDNALIREKPKLWDVWSPRDQPLNAPRAEWCNIQPLSATVWDHTPRPTPPNNVPPPHHSLAAAALAHLRRRYRRRTSQDGTLLDAKVNCDESLVRLQIAVTIAMPCPDVIREESRTELDDDEPPLEYCIGLYEMPWKKTH
ncbi:hypothetical protein MSAN_01919700 [Mycena sanguinolenta]|uniref:Uncharacterized protein n=1 Tax=Mycena sanguinolenta TaxID=230812 RepID=A0A8H6XMF1_9AGAR|nr:hypothetical protein MSAN_01919700 [Mycena sanguinolenta]